MAGVLKSSVTTYEFSLDAMKELIAKDLNVSPKHITVEYKMVEAGGYQDRGMYKTVGSVSVSVKKETETSDRWDR